MQNEDISTPFSKALLTGLFAGIVATLCCFTYDLIYTAMTSVPLTSFINVSTLIFGCNIFLTLAGMIYFFFLRSFKQGTVIFVVLFTLLTLFCIWKTASLQKYIFPSLTGQFKGLLLGVIIIIGININIAIPLLYNSKSFSKHVV